jgi:two-component system, NtrC family, nitrogen regulation response regulator NtrX
MRVLVVDDEENVRKGLATFLELSGHEALAVADLTAAREALAADGRACPDRGAPARAGTFQAALVDVYVGAENGASLLDFAAERRLRTPLIMMSGRGSVKDAVAAVRRGAYDFLEKPLDTDRLLATLRNLERETATERRLDALRDDWLSEHAYIEPGSTLAAAFESARRTAASPLSVLVEGPTGSGKELVARWIHLCSPRSQLPFVAVNCAAVPVELAESAFFGSRKGAYTGASADRLGYFEAASGGTLFLDEAGELPGALQAALLRAVETGEIQPVGAERSVRVDARIVAATNRDLRSEAAAGRFREDLYWRLAQVTVNLPSLEARRAEIRGLAEFLAAPIRAEMGSGAPAFADDALAYLEARSWPGNVRELRAFIERALWLAQERESLDSAYLESLERSGARAGAAASTTESPNASPPRADSRGGRPGLPGLLSLLDVPANASIGEAKDAFERAYVGAALEAAGGSVSRAAAALGLLPNNLSRKLKELGLR